MAKVAAEGHRVVLVVATDGALGLASEEFGTPDELAASRWQELLTSARALNVARVETLGYADSGMGPEIFPDPPGQRRFVTVPVEEAAEALAVILREERPDVLLSYDANGGYGHRDHRRVHEVAAAAVELVRREAHEKNMRREALDEHAITGTEMSSSWAGPRVLEATVPRDLLVAALRFVARFYRFPDDFDMGAFERAYSARAEITHRVNVIRFAGAKRASMKAHASQASADGDADRTLAAFLRIPRPVYDLVFGREWFRDSHSEGPVSRDIFDS